MSAHDRPRLRACVEAWPDAHEGGYDPRCCRFPKSCSADVYDPAHVTAEDLEAPAMTAPEPNPTAEHTDAVALDLDAVHETICDKFTGMAEVRQSADLLVAEVRRLVKFRDWWKALSLANAEDVRRLTAICHDWRDRSEAAEAEVGTLRDTLARRTDSHTQLVRENEALRAKVAEGRRIVGMLAEAVESECEDDPEMCHEHDRTDDGRCPLLVDLNRAHAALAVTTGEGEHVAREVFTADGIAFVRCSCTNAKSPTSFRWLTEHVPNGGVAELQAVIKRQGEGAKA